MKREPRPAETRPLDALRAAWIRFADVDCGSYAPLYAAVVRSVALDPELLELVQDAPPSGQQPNVLLAAVHELVLAGLEEPLAAAYADFTRSAVARTEVGALFADVCRRRRDELARRLAARKTQTNEPGRSAVLALGLAGLAREAGSPLALVDVGASAGLNLLFDRYRLDYGARGILGAADSPVRLECELRDPSFELPPLPPVAHRIGLDREPVDLTDETHTLWLRACIWPEHPGRLARLTAALELARRDPPKIVRGDVVRDLARVAATAPRQALLTIVTSWTVFYLVSDARRAFREQLVALGRERPVAWLSLEEPGVVPELDHAAAGPYETPPSVLGALLFADGGLNVRPYGRAHPHGAWFEPR